MLSSRSVLGIGFGSLTVSWGIAGIGYAGAGGTTSSISIISFFGVDITVVLFINKQIWSINLKYF